jgi:hypothetical protein
MLEVRSLRFRLIAVAIVIGLPAFLVAVGQGGPLFLLLLGLVLATFLLGCMFGLSIHARRRAFGAQFPPGTVLTTQFGADHLVLRRQWTATTVEFRAYDRLDTVGDWVFLHQYGRRVQAVYPLALVPPDDLSRLRLTILGRVSEDQ